MRTAVGSNAVTRPLLQKGPWSSALQARLHSSQPDTPTRLAACLSVAYRSATHGDMRALSGEKKHTMGQGLSKAVDTGAPIRPTGMGLQPHDSRLVTRALVALSTAEQEETTEPSVAALQGSQARHHQGPVCQGQGYGEKRAGGEGAAVTACAQRELSFPERRGNLNRKQ